MQIHDSEVYRPQRHLTAAAPVFQLDAVALVWGDQSHAQRFAFASQEVADVGFVAAVLGAQWM